MTLLEGGGNLGGGGVEASWREYIIRSVCLWRTFWALTPLPHSLSWPPWGEKFCPDPSPQAVEQLTRTETSYPASWREPDFFKLISQVNSVTAVESRHADGVERLHTFSCIKDRSHVLRKAEWLVVTTRPRWLACPPLTIGSDSHKLIHAVITLGFSAAEMMSTFLV